MFENLTELKVQCWRNEEPCIDFESLQDPINMPNLLSLEFDKHNLGILELIRSPKLEQFVFDDLFEQVETFESVFKEFLKNCPQLKRLRLSEEFPDLDWTKYDFRLESLEVRYPATLPSSFLSLLRIHKESMREMLLDVNIIMPDVLSFMYNEMKLEKLYDRHWNRSGLETGTNESLKFLTISTRMNQVKDFNLLEETVDWCYALEVLHVDMTSSVPRQVLTYLAGRVPFLKFVALSFCTLKQLKKISAWIRLNGLRASFMCTPWHSDYGDEKEIKWLGLKTLIVSSSKKDISDFKQFGKVKCVDSYYQVSKNSLDMRNLSIHKQARNDRKKRQARMFFDNFIIPKQWGKFGNYFKLPCSIFDQNAFWDDNEVYNLEVFYRLR